ncbi:MAG: redoxin family protein [Bacteroidales bacterium]|nr:redoxin family protein [Bacteroidales bacterium]
MKLISRTTLVAGMFIAAVGCGGGNSAVPKPTSPTGTTSAAKPAEIALHQVSATGFESLLAEAKGQPVLVDFWFLGCAPCKKKFPHIVELQARYAPDGLVVMSYSIMAEDWKEKDKVISFLNDKKAHFQHYVAKTTEDSDQVTTKYGVESTPAILLIDRAGKRIPVPEEVTDEELEGFIRQAIRPL